MEVQDRKRKAVAAWLLVGVFMIIGQILLGGITRLTGSGLSITDWAPIMGALPPTSDAAWQEAWQKYQQIPQYRFQNAHFTIEDFKSIYFWEWFHRLWARLLGVVFLIGFIFFWLRKYFDRDMIVPFIVLFILGGLQGAVGWIMVQSGLTGDSLSVSRYRLALHFLAALVLLVYTLWFALRLMVPARQRLERPRLRGLLLLILVVLGVQLFYGALMAGSRESGPNVAVTSAISWPTINGAWVPDTLGQESLVHAPLNIQFIHRTLAYTLCILIAIWWAMSRRGSATALFARVRHWPPILVLAQATLGVITLLSATTIEFYRFGTYELLALTHQGVAMLLLVALVINLYLLPARRVV